MTIRGINETTIEFTAHGERDTAALAGVIELALQKWREYPETAMRGTPVKRRGGFVGQDLQDVESALRVLAKVVGIGDVDLSPNLDCEVPPALDPLYRSTPAYDAPAGATPATEAEMPDQKAAASRAAQQHLMGALDGLLLHAALSQIFGARKPTQEKAAA